MLCSQFGQFPPSESWAVRRATERLKETSGLRRGPGHRERKLDRYGRTLAHLTVNGRDVGGVLIGEGLARQYNGGRRQGWCG